jgi:type I restriction enzyme R subunit
MSDRRGPDEKDTCRSYVVPRLRASGWTEALVRTEVPVVAEGSLSSRKGDRSVSDGRADYVLEPFPGVPVAVVEAKRLYASPWQGLQQGIEYALRLDVPLVYATNGYGIRERDLASGTERDLDSFPTPAETWARYVEVNELDEAQEDAIRQPLSRVLVDASGTTTTPRSYQLSAIHRVLRAVAGGERRVLLLMATGTGKTFTALQIVHKLLGWWKAAEAGRNHRVLYLADRDALVDHPQRKTFAPALRAGSTTRIQGQAVMGRDVYFATYQALDQGSVPGEVELALFEAYPRDFFDLVIVDECHRGSAARDSSWRRILDRYSGAVQLGLTATPKQHDEIDTYAYFGAPVFSYSLRQGIEDGYLAPYRVRRTWLSTDVEGWRPEPGQLDRFGREVPHDLYLTPDFERVVSLLTRTTAAARHLSALLAKLPHPRALVFCVDVEHAEQFRQAMVGENPDRVAADPTWVVRITGADGDTGKRLLEELCDPESGSPVVVTTSRMLSTGVDVPDLTHVVLFRPVGSIVEFKQIVGRGTRLYPEKGKHSFEIVDYVDATRLFDDPSFDGPAIETRVEEVNESGIVVALRVDDQGRPAGDGLPALDELEDDTPADELTQPTEEPPVHRKFVVDDVEVTLTAEGFRVPDTATGQLRLVDYEQYVGERVRDLVEDVEELTRRWADRRARLELLRELRVQGVDVQEVEERMARHDADGLDLLAYAAWGVPVVTRQERAGRAWPRLDEVGQDERAREAVAALLASYVERGVHDLSDPLALSVPPLSALGSEVEIAGWFGGIAGYRQAVSELQQRLYGA